MKIFFAGAQGTGKSTLVEELGNFLPEYEQKESSTRFFLKNKEDQHFSSPGYQEFELRESLYCLNNYVNTNNFISCRSIIDLYAYLFDALSKCTDTYISIFIEKMISTIDLYADLCIKDAIYFYLPIEFEINSNNPLRDTSKVFQKEIDKQMRYSSTLISSKGGKIYTITGTVEERIEKIKKILKNYI